MSKHVGNVTNPFEMIDKYGADPVRFYMMTNSEPWDCLLYTSLAWLYPWQELLVVHAFEVGTLHVVDNEPRALLLLLVEWQEIAFLALLVCLQL